MKYDSRVYGYVNGEPTYSRDEHVFKARCRGPIENDAELLEFAEKVTSGWYHARCNRTFETYFLSDYALSEPYMSLTKSEFQRLKELQAEARENAERIEDEKQWHYVETICWADNSEEEIWEDKYGNRNTVMTVYPHGDAC